MDLSVVRRWNHCSKSDHQKEGYQKAPGPSLKREDRNGPKGEKKKICGRNTGGKHMVVG